MSSGWIFFAAKRFALRPLRGWHADHVEGARFCSCTVLFGHAIFFSSPFPARPLSTPDKLSQSYSSFCVPLLHVRKLGPLSLAFIPRYWGCGVREHPVLLGEVGGMRGAMTAWSHVCQVKLPDERGDGRESACAILE